MAESEDEINEKSTTDVPALGNTDIVNDKSEMPLKITSESCSSDDEEQGKKGRDLSAVDLTRSADDTNGCDESKNHFSTENASKNVSSLGEIKESSAFDNNSLASPPYGNSFEAFMGAPHFMQALAAIVQKDVPSGLKKVEDSSSDAIVQDGGKDNMYSCTSCDYKTKLKRTFNVHMLKHEASKQLSCNHKNCNYTTSRSSDLKKHVRIHTGEKPYKCEECDYRSTELGALRKHMLTHSCDKPHCCPHCEYISPRIGDLKRHLHVHSDQKPHACQHCDYKASQLQQLRKHMLIHTRIKPYKCTFCDYRCREPRNLKTHIQTHTGDRPYDCPYCRYKAGRLGTLRRHISSIHPSEMGAVIPTASRHFLVDMSDEEESS